MSKLSEKEAKQILFGVRKLRNQLEKKLMQVEELRALAEGTSVSPDKEPVSGSSGDRMANIVGRMVDMEKEIEELYKTLRFLRTRIVIIAKRFQDDRSRDFLIIRYVECNGFFDTAETMGLSDSTAKRVEKRAIEEFIENYPQN